ncbi:hypothetical protein [Algoriphagus sp.]|uniref:hypothetical protein n=1 Tax=Algoriphagus sp. TaxID=1872435 RepID=UPI00261E6E95|nr:hypothetical protein [Algoriphagus sp.]
MIYLNSKIIKLNKGIRFLKEYSGEVWNFNQGLPNGILHKKFTGIGATTCEIEAPRNSILVFPTVSLAKSKCNKSLAEVKRYKENQEESSFEFFYVGGGVKNSHIEEFLEIKEPEKFTKFFVVADSLPRLIEILGESAYSDYFLMVDEIDTFQIDTSYRVSLEYAVDYFKEFTNKCALTATLIPFSDPEFDVDNLDYWVVEKEIEDKPDFKIIESNFPVDKIVEEIIQLIDSGERIVVAINSISNINRITKTLIKRTSLIKGDLGLLCSQYSKYDATHELEWIDVPENGEINLQHQVTFMTSAYFIGIDIKDIFHLIIGNINYREHTILTFEKIYQITGRARNGTYSTQLISFQRLELYKDFFDLEEMKSRISKINEILEFSKGIYQDGEFQDDYQSLQVSISKTKLDGQDGFLRINKDGFLVPSNFTIDYKNHFYESIQEYNDGLESLVERLEVYFNVEREVSLSDSFVSEIESYKGIDFIDSFSEKVQGLFKDLSKRIEENKEWRVGDIFNVYLFKFLEQHKSNKRLFCAGLQIAFFLDKTQSLELTKKDFIEFNSPKFKIKGFGKLLLLFQFYWSSEFKKFKGEFKLNDEYSAIEIETKISTLYVKYEKIRKFFIEKEISQQAYLVSVLSLLFKVEKVNRKFDPITRKKSPYKYKIIAFESPSFERLENSKVSLSSKRYGTPVELSDKMGSSIRYFLLHLDRKDIDYLLK